LIGWIVGRSLPVCRVCGIVILLLSEHVAALGQHYAGADQRPLQVQNILDIRRSLTIGQREFLRCLVPLLVDLVFEALLEVLLAIRGKHRRRHCYQQHKGSGQRRPHSVALIHYVTPIEFWVYASCEALSYSTTLPRAGFKINAKFASPQPRPVTPQTSPG